MKSNFKDYQLSSELLKAISLLNFKSPTKVQELVIPVVLEGKDLIVKSQTGSGKTAAFGIPICELAEWDDNRPQALVMVPTRELAMQVKEDIFNIGRFKRMKVAAIFGKSPFNSQRKELREKTHVVVGTPGRIIDHMKRGTLDLSNIKHLVIDEADEMLNMGFIEEIETIIEGLSKNRVTLLFSATMPKRIEELANQFMKDPIFKEIDEENTAVERILQERYDVKQREKKSLLRDLTIVENPDSCIIFCNTQQNVDEVYEELKKVGYRCRPIHGGMEQDDRLRIMHDFKKGVFRYLVATDVAARGIDVENISLVINYDLPQEKESYVHRIGRTGRVSKGGRAISFVTEKDGRYLQAIEKLIGREIPLKDRPKTETVERSKEEFIEKINTRPEAKENKGDHLNREIMKLHINAGKKTKMRPVDIVGTLCSIEGMTPGDIGIINVLDLSTFVEILNNKGEMVLRELQDRPIKGRLRKVSKAER